VPRIVRSRVRHTLKYLREFAHLTISMILEPS
jgi:hypothetical protein